MALCNFVEFVAVILAAAVLVSAVASAAGVDGPTERLEPSSLKWKDSIIVLVADPIKGYLNWLQPWFKEASRTQCNTQCILSDDKRFQRTADVILYHAPTHKTLNAPRQAGAVLGLNGIQPLNVFLSMEQPLYARFLANKVYLAKSFDLLLTYSLKSIYPGTEIPNMPITYYPLNILSPEAVMQAEKSFEEKTGYDSNVNVAAFVSNCKAAGADKRAMYLKELMVHIDVHSYGGCMKNREEPKMNDDPAWPAIAQRRARKVKVLSNYKFYLAFENSQVEDYVSEKVYESLFAGAVPIYRGAPGISNFMPGNHSFIDANRLTPVELANLIKSLVKDKTAYNEYFSYKKDAISENFQRIALESFTHPNAACRLCDYAMQRKKNQGVNPVDVHLLGSNATNPHLRYIRHTEPALHIRKGGRNSNSTNGGLTGMTNKLRESKGRGHPNPTLS